MIKDGRYHSKQPQVCLSQIIWGQCLDTVLHETYPQYISNYGPKYKAPTIIDCYSHLMRNYPLDLLTVSVGMADWLQCQWTYY